MTEVVKQVRRWSFASYCVAPQQSSVFHSVQWPLGLRTGKRYGETEEAVSEWYIGENLWSSWWGEEEKRDGEGSTDPIKMK